MDDVTDDDPQISQALTKNQCLNVWVSLMLSLLNYVLRFFNTRVHPFTFYCRFTVILSSSRTHRVVYMVVLSRVHFHTLP